LSTESQPTKTAAHRIARMYNSATKYRHSLSQQKELYASKCLLAETSNTRYQNKFNKYYLALFTLSKIQM